MTPARFLRDYWQKRPLLVRNAFPGLVTPLSPDELAGLACMDGALARIVSRGTKRRPRARSLDGERRADDRWTVRTGPFDDATFAKLPESRWTLLVQDVDKWDDATAALLDRFAFIPSWRIDDVMVSYAADGGGVGAHVDQYDVFLLQGLGRRRWRISIDPGASHESIDGVELKLLRRFTPTHEWTLDRGDMLYLPPGIPHDGTAVGECMTYSIGMRAPSQAELLVDFAEHLAQRIGEDARYTDPDLTLPMDAFEIDATALARVRTALSGLHADDAALAAWFGSFISSYRSVGIAAPPKPPTEASVRKALATGGTLARHPFVRTAWMRHGKRALLLAAGAAYPMQAEAARALAAATAIDAAQFDALDADAQAAVIALAVAGSYVVRKHSTRKPERSR